MSVLEDSLPHVLQLHTPSLKTRPESLKQQRKSFQAWISVRAPSPMTRTQFPTWPYGNVNHGSTKRPQDFNKQRSWYIFKVKITPTFIALDTILKELNMLYNFMYLGIYPFCPDCPNLLAYTCLYYFLTIPCISVGSVITSPLSFLTLFIWVLFFFFLISLVKVCQSCVSFQRTSSWFS